MHAAPLVITGKQTYHFARWEITYFFRGSQGSRNQWREEENGIGGFPELSLTRVEASCELLFSGDNRSVSSNKMDKTAPPSD